MKTVLSKAKYIYCIGIGGIGVSALARMFLLEGKKVSGSDAASSFVIDELKKYGAKIFIGQKASNIPKDVDVFIYTKAISEDNPEMIKAKSLDVPVLSYSEALGAVSSNKYTIAVSGSHGKTTTTGMIAWGLIGAKRNPTVVVGSFLNDLKTNFIAGTGKEFVVEACEYKKSFMDLNPRIIVITNIDNDHLDYYKTMKNLEKAFLEFTQKLSKDDFLVCNPNDKIVSRIAGKTKARVVDYSKFKINFPIKLSGEHNIKNTQAAMAVLGLLKIKDGVIKSSLSSFSGTARRFEYKGKRNGVEVYDDYAHHPTEIRATLSAARSKFKNKRLNVVFQPHLYSRTKILFDDFVKSFKDSDRVIILPIYAAREKKDRSISSIKLRNGLNKNIGKGRVIYFNRFDKALDFLNKNLSENDVLLTMGAGDVYKIGEKYLGK